MEEPQTARNEVEEDTSTDFGMSVQSLTPEIAEQLELDGGTGVVVTEVQPGSSADAAKLRTGDVILEVDRREVENIETFQEGLSAADDSVLLLIRRGNATKFVPMKRRE